MAALSAIGPGTPLASDLRSLDALRSRAAADPKLALREAARQFEALFMNELMKSMRATTLASDPADNAGAGMGTDLIAGIGKIAGRFVVILDTQNVLSLTQRPPAAVRTANTADCCNRHL